jgi:hypothetical protein
MRGVFGVSVAVLCAAGTSGCFAVVDVDRFHTSSSQSQRGDAGAGQGSAQYPSLKLTFLGMKPHLLQLVEFRVVESMGNFIQSRGVINPLGAQDVVINMPATLPPVSPPDSLRLDFYADVDMSGDYDGIGSALSQDHAWRIDPLADFPADDGTITHIDGMVQVVFTHNTSFTDIDQYPFGTHAVAQDTSLGATVHVVNASAFMNDLIQICVIDPGIGRTVGLFRVPQITQAAFDMKIPGVVEFPNDYEVTVYVDSNANGAYDLPGTPQGDIGWKLPASADASGLALTVDLSATNHMPVDVGAP